MLGLDLYWCWAFFYRNQSAFESSDAFTLAGGECFRKVGNCSFEYFKEFEVYKIGGVFAGI